jgi:hypothetical protein
LSAIARAALDHLIVAAETLELGEDYVESVLGVRPQRGGKHAAMGTHNSTLGLGTRSYLEVIAVDPEGGTPDRPRWFDLDRPSMQVLLAQGPRLIHWVARCDEIENARAHAGYDTGVVYPMSRGAYRWQITIPADGRMPGDGLLPTLIQWSDAPHPADSLPDARIRIVALAGAHPEPASIRAPLAALGLSATLPVTYNKTPRLAAMLRTPRGVVTL